MNEDESDYRSFLDPKVLASISGLELRARRVIDGYFSGIHHSPHHGVSVEFADHRSYTQGDDLRHIDWKVFGKTDKYYIKEYEQETNLDVLFAVDGSASMGFRSADAPLSKFEYATILTASAAYLALRQRDAVGLAVFDDHLTEYIIPSNRAQQWKTIVRELDRAGGAEKTALEHVLHELAERLPRAALIVVVSDLFADETATLRGLRHLQHRGHDVVVWNLWDAAELTLPLRGPTMFVGLEAEGQLLADPRSLQARYVEEVERFRRRLRTGCGQIRVEIEMFDTSTPLDVALSGYLAARASRLRRRSARVTRGA